MRSLFRTFFAVATAAFLAAPAAHGACAGDCDGDAQVGVSELVRAVNIALGNQDVSNCRAVDTNSSGSVAINELVAAVASALNGCPAPTPTATPAPTPTGGVIDPIFPANYRDAYVLVRDCRLSIEHGGVSIRVYANSTGAQSYVDHDNPLPVGSVIIKEEFNGTNCNDDEELIRWAAMRKEQPGFDSEDGDFHWQRVNAPSRTVECDDKLCRTFPCLGCHQEPACLSRDYMCTEGEAPRGNVKPVLQQLPAALLSVSGRSATDVYAVGADTKDGKGPLVMHYNGIDWRRLESGATGNLWWISVTPIDGDFYMAGTGGQVLQLDPDSGVFTPRNTPGNQTLFGVWGATATDLFAVGEDDDNPSTGGVVWRYDGETWTAQDLTGVRAGGIPGLLKVWGRGPNEVYAVGRGAFAMRFDGESWSEIPVSGIPTTRPIFTVHGNQTLTAASGGFLEGYLLELASGTLTNRAAAGTAQQNGIFVPPDGRAVGVGTGLSVSVREAGIWEIKIEGTDAVRDYHAVWIDPDNGVWAVGGDLTIDLADGIVSYGGLQPPSAEIVP